MNEQQKQQLDDVIKNVINPVGICEVISRKLFMVNSPCQQWSFRNHSIMLLNDAFDCRGYVQWQQVNRQVKKGSKAVKIMVPKLKTIYKKNEKGEKEKSQYCDGFISINVFKVTDTDGEELEYYKDVMDAESKKHTMPLYDVALDMGIDVTFAPTLGRYAGYYSHNGSITLSTDSEQVFFHELSHAIDHRLGNLTIGSGQQVDNEIVAELASCYFATMYGQKTDIKATHDYISNYSGKTHVSSSIFKYLKRVEEIINYVIDFKK